MTDPWIAAVPPGPVAHTPNSNGRWHPLNEHLCRVANLARDFASPLDLGECAYWCGLLHDLGKYTPAFQDYLRACHLADLAAGARPVRGSAPHKQHGAAFAAQRILDILAIPILGHHGGLPARGEAKSELQREAWTASATTVHASATQDCPPLGDLPSTAALARLKETLQRRAKTPLEAEVILRFLYSMLVDADALDTESHTDPDSHRSRTHQNLTGIPELLERFLCNQKALQEKAAPSRINELRRQISTACMKAAQGDPGVYKLTVPTGGGKTRSSLAFALEHAARHNLQRVIYAAPYTTIVDQTADVLEQIFGHHAVLEHHSAIEPEDGAPEHEMWRRLAAQNWDASLIVTTTVQLFESLFGNRPARSRKVHRLAKSVIILDEVQTLPVKLLKPLVDILRTLSERYGATLLLCTATQPALDQKSLEQIGFHQVREIAPDPPRLFRELRRVRYDLSPLRDGPWSWDKVAAIMRKTSACLTVVNTRRDSHLLLDALQDPNALHLSTLMCGRHRRETLTEIRRRLKAGEPCHVASTQAVECGCDLDFPLVMRAAGPLDRIVQAAGRCNREGLLAEAGRVIVFQPEASVVPRGSYAVATSVAQRYLKQVPDLHDSTVFENYFREVFQQDDTDARRVQKLRGDLDFPEVARHMRFIDQETIGILVPYRPAAREINVLRTQITSRSSRMTHHIWRSLQPYLVTVPSYEARRYQSQGLLVELAEGFFEWLGTYDEVRGLSADWPEPADLILA